MLKILLLFLVLITHTVSQSVCTSRPTLLNVAYTECTFDPICMNSFYLSESEEVWERPRFDYLMLKVLNTVAANVTLICSDAEIFSEWFSVVKHWDFCRKNEVYSMIDGGCVCNSGKNCDPKMHGSSGYTTKQLEFLILLVLIGGAYFHIDSLNTLKTIFNLNKNNNTKPSNAPTSNSQILPRTVFSQ